MSDDFLTESALRVAGLDDNGIADLKAAIAEFNRALANLNSLVIPHIVKAVAGLNVAVGQINQRMNQ